MDGILIDLLNAKWNTFVKSRFYRQFFLFCFYFVLSLISFTLRPGPSETTVRPLSSTESPTTHTPDPLSNFTLQNSSLSEFVERIVADSLISNIRPSFNVTPDSLMKLKFDIVSDLMSTLKNTLPIDTGGNMDESKDVNYSQQLAHGSIKHLYRRNDTTKDYLKSTINESYLLPTKLLIDRSSNRNDWYYII